MPDVALSRSSFLPAGVVRTGRTAGKAAIIVVSAEDLPAACPGPSMPLWSGHPRIFLDVVNHDVAMCPYCGTRYRLRPGVHLHEHEFGTRCLHQHRKQPAG